MVVWEGGGPPLPCFSVSVASKGLTRRESVSVDSTELAGWRLRLISAKTRKWRASVDSKEVKRRSSKVEMGNANSRASPPRCFWLSVANKRLSERGLRAISAEGRNWVGGSDPAGVSRARSSVLAVKDSDKTNM